MASPIYGQAKEILKGHAPLINNRVGVSTERERNQHSLLHMTGFRFKSHLKERCGPVTNKSSSAYQHISYSPFYQISRNTGLHSNAFTGYRILLRG